MSLTVTYIACSLSGHRSLYVAPITLSGRRISPMSKPETGSGAFSPRFSIAFSTGFSGAFTSSTDPVMSFGRYVVQPLHPLL